MPTSSQPALQISPNLSQLIEHWQQTHRSPNQGEFLPGQAFEQPDEKPGPAAALAHRALWVNAHQNRQKQQQCLQKAFDLRGNALSERPAARAAARIRRNLLAPPAHPLRASGLSQPTFHPLQLDRKVIRMNPSFDSYNGSTHYQAATQQRNRVMRNTYWLLALSMIPTVLGAYVGLATNMTAALSGGLGAIVFLAGAFGFMFAIEKTKNSGLGVVLLLAFTFFMGLMLSRLLGVVLGMSNGSQLVMTAFAGTAGVFATMATVASTTKRSFDGAGKWLFVGAIVLLVSGLLNIFVFQSTALYAATSTVAIVLFSFWLLYDLKRIVDGGEVNYISATLSLYLSLYNIFQSLLGLLGIFGGED